MSSALVGVGSGVILLTLLMLGLPVAFAMALVGAGGLALVGGVGPAVGLLASLPYSTVASFSLIVIPMFILMGELVGGAGLAQKAYLAARQWFGRLPGGLAVAAIGASAFFAAVSGSSVAATATMGKLSIGEMRRHGYDGGLATGTVVAAGTLAALIPPSAMAVFYALVTDQSVSRMLFAGVGPGLVSTVLFMVVAWLMARRNPRIRSLTHDHFSWAQKAASLKSIGPFLVLIVVVLGGIYSGVVTVTEASALGALCTLAIVAFAGKLSWTILNDSLTSSVRISCMIFLIIIGGMLYSRFLAFAGIPFAMVESLGRLQLSPTLVVIVMLLIMTVLGMFMDPVGMIMLTLPFFFPIVKSMGIDPIWFGVLVILQAELAVITPPVGIHLFVARQIAPDVPLIDIIKGSVPFMTCQILVMALVIVAPQLALWLPMRLAP